MELVSNVSAFLICCLEVGHSFSSKERVSFNFKAAVSICCDFGAQKNKVCHCFHCFLIYLPWSDGTGCHKEGWVLKNWCFGTAVLEKTFESSFNCKEIKPANPKGNWPWIFSGMTNAEVEAPLLWPPDAGSQLFGKDPDPGRDWRQEEKGTTED